MKNKLVIGALIASGAAVVAALVVHHKRTHAS